MKIKNFFDKDTATFTYVVSDPKTNSCAVIDSVLNYDMYSGKTFHSSADRIISYIQENNLNLEWILETHIHADHLTAASYLKEKIGGKIGISTSVKEVLKFWIPLFDSAEDTAFDGSQFDHLFQDNETFKIGSIDVKVILTPGHTPACLTYLIQDAAFVGDTIFMPYVGTARTDFPGGSSKTLFHSIQKILSLPETTRIFVGHDYPLQDAKENHFTTVAEQKEKNIMINQKVGESEYVAARDAKDKGKAVPKLLFPSLQINLRAGNLGKIYDNGAQFIKIPLNRL